MHRGLSSAQRPCGCVLPNSLILCMQCCRASLVNAAVRRGGLIFWADLVGAQYIVSRLQQLSQQFAPAGLGGFFEPCGYLKAAAASGRRLSDGRAAGPASRL
eukprot:GHRQ01033205.1.p2 GENE.GHRQ01033205.1~~GHRQ01033205.1.p2  ORF type:complete len:102 (-),score=22.64 GHRQ01033205.1:348-653(-)